MVGFPAEESHRRLTIVIGNLFHLELRQLEIVTSRLASRSPSDFLMRNYYSRRMAKNATVFREGRRRSVGWQALRKCLASVFLKNHGVCGAESLIGEHSIRTVAVVILRGRFDIRLRVWFEVFSEREMMKF
jgi:hypothetical protein